MQNKSDEWKQKYDALVKGKLERLQAMSPEEKASLREQFTHLFAQVEETMSEGPAAPRAQELASRYVELLRAFTLTGELDPQLQKVVAAYLSAGQSPADAPALEPSFGGKRVWEFMAKALAARQ